MKVRIASIDDTREEGLLITYELLDGTGEVITTKSARIPWDAVKGLTIAEIKGSVFRHGRESLDISPKRPLKAVLEGLEEDLA